MFVKDMRQSHIESVYRTSNKPQIIDGASLNIAVTDMLLEAMDNKQLSIVIFLDMSNAFDSVDHNMFLQRILNLSVSSAVHINGLKVACLTDGSMLELELPLRRLLHCRMEFLKALFYRRFYLIYTQIASLQFPCNSCSLESYVDDSKTFLSFSLSHIEHSLLHIEEDLHRIFEWCCNNSLLENPEKNKMLVVGTRQLMNQLESPVHINFMGGNLTPVTCRG